MPLFVQKNLRSVFIILYSLYCNVFNHFKNWLWEFYFILIKIMIEYRMNIWYYLLFRCSGSQTVNSMKFMAMVQQVQAYVGNGLQNVKFIILRWRTTNHLKSDEMQELLKEDEAQTCLYKLIKKLEVNWMTHWNRKYHFLEFTSIYLLQGW